MINRTQKAFSEKDIKNLSIIYHSWHNKNGKYKDISGYYKSSSLEEIEANDYILTLGRYVDVAESEDDRIPFHEKMNKLTKQLKEDFDKSRKLEKDIKENLSSIGFKI